VGAKSALMIYADGSPAELLRSPPPPDEVRTAALVAATRPGSAGAVGPGGTHPNKAHAAWGRRAHRLEPDPDTEHVVRWMFAQRLAGHSVARIARALNDAVIPCPSAARRRPASGPRLLRSSGRRSGRG
jgi:hypothetical protein